MKSTEKCVLFAAILSLAASGFGAPAPDASGADTTVVAAGNISAVWANEGGDKVTRDELRATNKTENSTGTVKNRVWDGAAIHLAGARNEVISFDLVLEAAQAAAGNVSVTFDTLTGPNGYVIHSTATDKAGTFKWTTRPIELFLAKYVQIQGLSYFGYYKGDERQIPTRFRSDSHLWANRPDHDKFYPDALVPIEATPTFTINQGQNQSVWADLYLPKTAPAGTYTGAIQVSEGGNVTRSIPVTLTLNGFALPDTPTEKTATVLDTADLAHRYVSPQYQNWASAGGQQVAGLIDNTFELFQRHKIGVLGEGDCPVVNHPCDSSLPRLQGSLYTPANGYDGPGVNTPVNVYSIGTYANWPDAWRNSQSAMTQGLNDWGSWFQTNLPNATVVFYLYDEPPPSAYPQIETWANWMSQNTGPGSRIQGVVTTPAVNAQTLLPHLNIPIQPSGIGNCPLGQPLCNNTQVTQAAHDAYHGVGNKQFWTYNDGHPGAGSAMTEDDGIAMRTLGWAEWKMKIDRWFYWYANINCGGAANCGDWYNNATTWGHRITTDPALGQWGPDAPSNGNGLLIYPGTDIQNPGSNFGLPGPVASIRLKEWRRGIQDADYLELASKIDPAATAAVVQQITPKLQWELTVSDPSFYVGPMPFSSNPDDWEAARASLAAIISNGCTANPSQPFCQ